MIAKTPDKCQSLCGSPFKGELLGKGRRPQVWQVRADRSAYAIKELMTHRDPFPTTTNDILAMQ